MSRPRTPIFYYHSIGGPLPQTLPREGFRRHLEILQELGLSTCTVAELVQRGPRPGEVVLTFDDGLLDNYTVAFPMLLEFGFRATFYVVPGYDHRLRYVNPCTGGWSDDPRPGFTQIFENTLPHHRQEMHRHGMEIGCHTMTHRKLTRVPAHEWKRELVDSKHLLEEELQAEVSTFCYPNGRFNPAIYRAVRQAGYRAACSTLPGYYWPQGPRYALQRCLIEDPIFFRYVAAGRGDSLAGLGRLVGRFLQRKLLPWTLSA